MCGLLEPSSGSGKILNYELIKDRNKIKKYIGYLSQKFSLYSDLSIDENIEFFAELNGVKDYKQTREELLEFMRLKNYRRFLARNLSGGMKQKLSLACTLIHKPKIIFLDEPTTGVDPVSRRDFWKILSELHNENITIVISTPYLDDAERFNNIIMMNKGRVLMNSSPENIKQSVNFKIMEITTDNPRELFKLISLKLNNEIQLYGNRIDIICSYDDEITEIDNLLKKYNFNIFTKKIKLPSLENVFTHLLKENLNDQINA
jgi:ABC-2 type transport system ATP-binding protein